MPIFAGLSISVARSSPACRLHSIAHCVCFKRARLPALSLCAAGHCRGEAASAGHDVGQSRIPAAADFDHDSSLYDELFPQILVYASSSEAVRVRTSSQNGREASRSSRLLAPTSSEETIYYE